MEAIRLVDPQGRHIHKLRLALLDACNFRCLYCMPAEVTFLDKKELLTREEIFRLSKDLTSLGIDEIRLTGGEPTLRSDLLGIVEDLSTLDIKKLGLTTNGTKVKHLLPALKKTKCQNINFSLDSLGRENFKKITGRDDLERVLESIYFAVELGLNVKINVVAMRGINDHEVEDFVEFSRSTGVEVRFLELMKIGIARARFDQQFISADEMIGHIREKNILEVEQVPIDSTSFNFKVGNGGRIGFIASESRPFCSDCSRLRLSATGTLRPCLMLDDGVSIRQKGREEILETLFKVMALKPKDRIRDVAQGMYQIGG